METATDVVARWFSDHLPTQWCAQAPEVLVDDEEILVICPLAPVAAEAVGEDPAESSPGGGHLEGEPALDAPDEAQRRLADFRADTKPERMALAQEAQALFRRQVSWGARYGPERQLFTTLALPVMTRLRLPERSTLDTLIESGVARSRSDALSWCVRLVATHESDWIDELRSALTDVRRVRQRGPRVR